MIIIETKFHGPTNHRGARISARCATFPEFKRVAVPYDHGSTTERAHLAAALALLNRINERPTVRNLPPFQIERGTDERPRVASAGPRGYYFIARSAVE